MLGFLPCWFAVSAFFKNRNFINSLKTSCKVKLKYRCIKHNKLLPSQPEFLDAGLQGRIPVTGNLAISGSTSHITFYNGCYFYLTDVSSLRYTVYTATSCMIYCNVFSIQISFISLVSHEDQKTMEPPRQKITLRSMHAIPLICMYFTLTFEIRS